MHYMNTYVNHFPYCSSSAALAGPRGLPRETWLCPYPAGNGARHGDCVPVWSETAFDRVRTERVYSPLLWPTARNRDHTTHNTSGRQHPDSGTRGYRTA